MVGLGSTGRDDGIGALLHGVSHQVFELACLVAACGKAGAIVPLDPESRAAEQIRQTIHRLQRRVQMGERYAGETAEIHEMIPR